MRSRRSTTPASSPSSGGLPPERFLEVWLKEFPTADSLRPDEAVKLTGVQPEDGTNIVISHAHWDHMGGIELFPKATVWIQKQEFAYYTGDAWQPGDGTEASIPTM